MDDSTRGHPSSSPDPSNAGASSGIEALVAAIFDAIQEGDAQALARMCARHPEHASALRARVEVLERAGLLDLQATRRKREFPERLGDFRLIERLGAGGMGVVYRAEQSSLGREVALKLIRPDQLYFPGAHDRFRREVELIARLQHPGIVPVHTVGEEQGIPYFAMELVHGATIAELLEELEGQDPARIRGAALAEALERITDRPVERDASLFRGSWEDVCLRAIRSASAAVAYAHARGVLHRDVKPSNLMLTLDGRVLLLDFGLASTEGVSKLTRTGSIVGSVHYMAPEILRGNEATAQSDVYSLGATLFELLALDPPYRGESYASLRAAILEGDLPRLRSASPRCTWDAETITLVSLDPEPERRYGTADALAGDLDRALKREPLRARRASPALRLKRWTQRNPLIAVAALIVVGLPSVLLLQQHAANRELGVVNEELEAVNAKLAESLAREGAERERAQANLDRAIDAVDGMMRHVAEIDLDAVPQAGPVRRALLAEARVLFDELIAQTPDNPDRLADQGRLYHAQATILDQLGDGREADSVFRQAIATLENSLERRPDDGRAIRLLGSAWRGLGELLDFLDRDVEALEALRSAELTFGRHPDPDSDPGMLQALDMLCEVQIRVLSQLGRYDEAAAALERQIEHLDLRMLAAREEPEALLELRLRKAMAYSGFGRFDSQRVEQGLKHDGAAFHILRELLVDAPNLIRAREQFAGVSYNYAIALEQSNRPDDAEAVLREGLDVGWALVDEYPATPMFRLHLGMICRLLARTLVMQGKSEEVDELLETALAHQRRLIEENPREVAYRFALGMTLADQSVVVRDSGQRDLAVEIAREAVGHVRHASDAAPNTVHYRVQLGYSRIHFAEHLLGVGDLATAADEALQAFEIVRGDPGPELQCAAILAACSDASVERTDRQSFATEAIRMLDSAVAIGATPREVDRERWAAVREASAAR